MSKIEQILTAIIDGGTLDNFTPQSRNEEILVALLNKLNGEEVGTLPDPQSRMEALLEAVLEKIGEGGGGGDIHISDYILPYYLTGKLVIPDTTAKVGKDMYAGFTSVNALDIPDSVTEIDEGAFSSLGYNNNPAGIELHAKKVVSIGPGAFFSAYGLKYITLESCKTIGTGAFSGCTNVTSVSLPVCELIGNAGLSQCQMTSIKLPEIKTIGEGTFGGCTQLGYIYLGANCTSIGQQAFGGAPITCKVECGFAEGAVAGFPANAGFAGNPASLDITYNVAEPSV